MHPLKAYLRDVGETIQAFGARVSASRQTLYRIIGGAQAPKPALARRIVEATGGAVTFEALYPRPSGGPKTGGEVVGLNTGEAGGGLNPERVRVALAIVVDHLAVKDKPEPPDAAVTIAAEAVVNTYIALSTVTTRQGPERFCQALRPVLEEILREYSASPPPPAALDRGAELATQIYFQSWNLDQTETTAG
ncbi:MAG: helix-turn-helix transcriptional regulator [Alphaproteobacteria bacterium]|nr:helix-turn-helix transcriptional regulator [Alphaproteobacteria bacterium]